MDDIEDRLRSHAEAFDGLLSLIPAKYYYGEDASDQWQRKKQTKEEAREAKRAKLDPDSAKTAKDVMDESAKKRKRDEDDDASEDSSSEQEVGGGEIPKEGLKRGDAKKPRPDEEPKKSKSAEEAESRKKLKEEKKEKKKAAQKEKKKAKESAKKEKQPNAKPANAATKEQEPSSKEEDSDDSNDDEDAAEGLSLMFNPEQPEQPSTASSTPNSPNFDVSNNHSGSSSISSIVPPTTNESAKQEESSEPKPLKPTPEDLKQRLQKRLDELRAARHADGLNGRPARNRQELIEARRQKAEQRKTHKKMLRQKAKEEEQQKNDEAMARRFSPSSSGSLLASPRSPADSTSSNTNASYSFGRVVFADGQHADPTLSSTRDKPKQSGAKDPASALQAAESKNARLAGMDETKRADIEEKDLWLNAKKRAHGERVRDDTSLLKKALKRKESAKRKSEREWKERADTVKKGKEMKQTKREENLRKRREEKGANKGKNATGGGGKKKARPGFEGSFKTKVGGKKK